MTALENLKEQVLALPVEEREALVDFICASISPAERLSIDRAWEREAEETWAAVQGGEMETIPMEKVHGEVHQRLGL